MPRPVLSLCALAFVLTETSTDSAPLSLKALEALVRSPLHQALYPARETIFPNLQPPRVGERYLVSHRMTGELAEATVYRLEQSSGYKVAVLAHRDACCTEVDERFLQLQKLSPELQQFVLTQIRVDVNRAIFEQLGLNASAAPHKILPGSYLWWGTNPVGEYQRAFGVNPHPHVPRRGFCHLEQSGACTVVLPLESGALQEAIGIEESIHYLSRALWLDLTRLIPPLDDQRFQVIVEGGARYHSDQVTGGAFGFTPFRSLPGSLVDAFDEQIVQRLGPHRTIELYFGQGPHLAQQLVNEVWGDIGAQSATCCHSHTAAKAR